MGFRAGTHWAGEDVVQTAYMRAVKYYRTLHGEEFEKWFATILNNSLRDYKNQEREWQRGIVHTYVEDEEESNEQCPHYTEKIVKEINELINTKSVIQMEVLSLYFNHELSAKDISCITTHSHDNVRQIIHRFRKEIRELYG